MLKHFLALIALIALIQPIQAAVIHGQVFEWSSLDDLNNVIVTINTIPEQRIVSKEGSYSFEVPSGSYSLHAVLLENGKTKYAADENITVKAEGDFVLDLIMFPLLEEELDMTGLEESGLDLDLNEAAFGNGIQKDLTYIYWIVIILIAAGSALFLFFRKKNRQGKQTLQEKQATQEKKHEPEQAEKQALEKPMAMQFATLDEDERKVIETIKKSEGRITQLDLRKKLEEFGEAKLSLILTELEHSGLVKKIKKGRGNVIILSKDLR